MTRAQAIACFIALVGYAVVCLSQTHYVLLTTGEVAAAATTTTTTTTTTTIPDIPTNGLAAYWPFNGDMLDYGLYGYGNDMTGVATATNGVSGVTNTAYYFNGSNTVLLRTVGDGNINTMIQYTAMAWVNAKTSAVVQQGILVNKTSPNYRYALAIERSGSVFKIGQWDPTGAAWRYGTTNMQYETWNHIAVTHDGSTVTIYGNGLLQSSASCTMKSPNDELWIGGWSAAGTFPFFGTIDEVRIYNRVLSSSEVYGVVQKIEP